MRSFIILIILLITVSFCVFLFQLGARAFRDYDEAHYASVIETTLVSDDIYSLRVSKDSFWFEKPPLYFWAAMGSEKIFTQKEFAYRLPAALAGVSGVILITLITLEISGSYGAALLSGLILLTTFGFVEAGRQVRMDVPVVAAILLSFYSFLKGRKNSWWLVGVGVGVGIGVMVKSVIGFFAFPIILIWALINKEWTFLKRWQFWFGLLLMLVILLPWHIYELVNFGKMFWDDYFSYQVVQRFGENILGGSPSNLGYLKDMFSFSAPWTPLFFFGLLLLFLRYENLQDVSKKLLSLALIVLFIVSLFLYAKTKYIYYFTPIYPFVASLVAITAWKFYKHCWRCSALVGITLLLSLAIGYGMFRTSDLRSGLNLQQLIAEDEKQIGIIVSSYPEVKKLYVYQFPFPDPETLRYYSGGRDPIKLEGDEKINDESFLVVQKAYFNAYVALPNFTPIVYEEYRGQTLALLRLKP